MHEFTSKIYIYGEQNVKESQSLAVCGYETCILWANLGCTDKTVSGCDWL